MKKKLIYFISVLVFLIIISIIVNEFNPYLRTDIFRSFAKGNWYITSEEDTLYTMGYYGVRKYYVDDLGNQVLLAENDKFCTDRIFGRGGCVSGEYLYVTARSFLPIVLNDNRKKGILLVLRKKDLSIVKEFESDIKLVEGKILGDILVVSGLYGFCIYDHSTPNNPKELFSYRHPKYREYQGFEFIEKDGEVYLAFTLYKEGLEIWNITHPESATEMISIPIGYNMKDGSNFSGGQSMDVLVNYPYLYATLGPTNETFNTESDRRGILVYDISDISNIKSSVVLIPKADWYNKKTGDRQPTYITRYKNTLYVNFAEKGVAKFDISDAAKPCYKGVKDISGKGALIQPIHATKEGKLFVGSYYWPTIYYVDINKQ